MRSYNVDKYRTVRSTVDDLRPSGIGGHGDMPPSMLMAKFEETTGDMYEENYDNYARGLLTDWGPDNNKFEHEEVRGSVNRSSGRLQLLHNGHRGDAETPYRSEHFDGFMGNEDRDPRGINTEPDTKKLVEQATARTRFIRFSADGNDQVTGGGRSEAQLMADQQKMYRRVRGQWVIFDRQLDGRREGMHRQWAAKSAVPKALATQSYGDLIRDHALSPQHRARVICGQILRDTNWYRKGTSETDWATAAAHGGPRRQRRICGDRSIVEGTDGEAEYAESDNTLAFKAAGILLANICAGRERAKRIAITGMDADLAQARDISIRKTAPFVKDLSLILSSVKMDQPFADADITQTSRTPTPMQQDSAVCKWSADNIAPAHHWMAAEIIYKGVKPGADTRKIAGQVLTMSQFSTADANIAGKSAKYRMKMGAKLCTANDGDLAVSRATYNYKTGKTINGDRRLRLVDRNAVNGESDITRVGRTQKTNYRIASADDVRQDGHFNNNDHQDRHIGVLGTKYLNREVKDDDGTLTEW